MSGVCVCICVSMRVCACVYMHFYIVIRMCVFARMFTIAFVCVCGARVYIVSKTRCTTPLLRTRWSSERLVLIALPHKRFDYNKTFCHLVYLYD